MYGAKPFSSTLMRRALSASQFASSPSPSEVARPMPVIQTSVDPGWAGLASVMGNGLLGKADALGHGFHVSAQIRIREWNMAERDGRVALQLAADPYLRLGHRIARALVKHVGVDRQQFPRGHEAAHLGFLDRGEERHALEFHQREQQPTRGLRHRFNEQDAGHDRIAREMSLEYGVVLRDLRLDLNGFLVDVEVENAVDQLEIFKLHGGRLGTPALDGDQFVDARAEVFQDKVLFGGRLAVVDFLRPFFERQLDTEGLVDRERNVEKIEAVDPQIVDGVALGRDRVARYVAGFSDDRGDLIECR